MSNTYLNLKTDIAGWLDRDDLLPVIPSFVRVALNRINRKLRIFDMEDLAVTSLEDTQYYEFPPMFRELRNIYIDTDPPTKLTYLTPVQMAVYVGDESATLPLAYTMIDGAFKLNMAVESSSNNLLISYIKGYSMFDEDDDTNWLLDNCFDIILYGSLLAAESYIMTDERLPIWKQQFEESIIEQNDEYENAKMSGDVLRIRSM